MVLQEFLPDGYVEKVSDYDFEKAAAAGKKLVLFDIDNTFVPHGAPADGESLKLIERLKGLGFRLCAVSNNHEPRVKLFADAAGIDYVFDAGKPSAKGYLKAMKNAGAAPGETVFFGDQLFTDVWGARRAGIESILVKPVDRSTDEIQIRFKRILERPLVKAFFRDKGIAIDDYFH